MKADGIERPAVLMCVAMLGGVLAAAPLTAADSRPQPAGAPSVSVAPEDGKPVARATPVTFGMVFRAGDIPKGKGIEVRSTGQAVAAQVDVKRHYDDGSVRFAIVSAALPGLDAAGVSLACAAADAKPEQTRSNASAAAKNLLATDFDAAVTLKFPDGKSASASARKMLEAAGDKAETWLSGPVVTEWLLMGPLTDAAGKADPDLNVQFQVRAYAGTKAARVSVVVENCWDTWAGNIGYDVTIQSGKDGKLVHEKKGVDHRRLSRWRKTCWWGTQPADVVVAHDPAYLSDSGALPNYDRTLKISEKELASMAVGWARSPETDIMGSGSLCKYMPTTGGRPEIGPYPAWTVRYLLSMDPRPKALVLGNGDLAGSWPIHMRSAKTGRVMTLDERPTFWFHGYKDGDGYERPKWQADRKVPPAKDTPQGKGYTLTPDVAHMGSFAYVPYLVTGDFYYLEEAYFWGAYTLLAQWTVPRQGGKGLMCDQIRGNAWGLRNIADAGFIAPDGDPEGKYFETRIRNNMEFMTAKMYGPPEYNKMGFWGIRTIADARIQNAANPNWMVTAPWEHDYLIWSLHHLTELGYADAAKPRDFELRWRVGVFTHPDAFNPLLGAPYRMVVGETGPGKRVTFYDDWKKFGQENAMLNKPGLGYNYSAYLALVCGVDAGIPGAAEAVKVLLDKNGGFKGMLAGPEWRIVPRAGG